MLNFLKSTKAVELLLILLAAALVFFLIQPAFASGELTGARPPMAYGFASADTARIQVSATRAQELPSAYLIWSGDAASFYLNTYLTSASISTPIKVPTGQPITLPAPPPYLAYGKYWHRILIYAPSVTDSVYVIPLDR